MLRAGPSFLKQGQNAFLEPGILAAHDGFRQAVDGGVFLVSEDFSCRGRGRIQTIRHILTEIRDQLMNPGLRAHFWLGRKPECRSHGKKPEALIHQVLQQELLIMQALTMAERCGKGRTCQAS